ncbi:MAG: hypothetical protein U0132_16760 [Gemmatimonadaceae bacterium]
MIEILGHKRGNFSGAESLDYYTGGWSARAPIDLPTQECVYRTPPFARTAYVQRQLRRLVSGACAAGLIAAVACSGDATGASPLDATYQLTFDDPVGDTIITAGTNVFPRALDVSKVRVGLTTDTLFVRLDFTAPITLWSANTPESVDGFVDFDVDDNATSGGLSAVDEFGFGTANLGVDFYVSLRDDGLGNILWRSFTTRQWRTGGITATARSITLRLPRADIGELDGVFGLSALVAGQARVATDAVPNQGHFRIAIP